MDGRYEETRTERDTERLVRLINVKVGCSRTETDRERMEERLGWSI